MNNYLLTNIKKKLKKSLVKDYNNSKEISLYFLLKNNQEENFFLPFSHVQKTHDDGLLLIDDDTTERERERQTRILLIKTQSSCSCTPQPTSAEIQVATQ